MEAKPLSLTAIFSTAVVTRGDNYSGVPVRKIKFLGWSECHVGFATHYKIVKNSKTRYVSVNYLKINEQ